MIRVGPDGKQYNFPEDTTEQQIQSYFARMSPAQAVTPVETQKTRSFVQGLTFGFGEEIEAAAKSALGAVGLSEDDRNYEQIRDELRQKLADYQAEYPAAAITAELAGAIIPGLLTMGTGLVASAGLTGARVAPTAGRVALIGAGEGGLAAAGYSEREGMRRLQDVPGGAVAGAVFSGLSAKLGEGFKMFASRALGERPATRVQAELQRLQEGTGKTTDEIVADLLEGRLMSENRELMATLRAYKSQLGEAGAEITQRLPQRAAETRETAVAGLQAGLTPRMGDRNVMRAMQATDDQLLDLEREGYRQAFDTVPEVSPEIAENLQGILQRFGPARSEVQQIYSESDKLVPLFREDEAGAIVLTRMPTLEDAEIIRRALRDEASGLYQAGKGTRAEGFATAESTLKSQLDESYTGLEQVRSLARTRRLVRDQFEEGRKALSKDADEIEIVFGRLQESSPEAADAYRAGVMAAINNRLRRSPQLMGRLADPDRQEGSILRAVFPEDQIEDVARRLEIAGRAKETEQQVLFGSQTAPQQAAAAQIGTRTSAEDILRMSQGDIFAMTQQAGRLIAQAAPNLNDRERMQVVEALMSQDPDLVRRALTDRDALGKLYDRTAQVMNTLGFAGRGAAVQQIAPEFGRPTGGLLNFGEQR